MLGGCALGGDEAERLRAVNYRSWELAGDSATWGAALALIDGAAAGYETPRRVLLGGGGSARDSVLARLFARKGYLHYALGQDSLAFAAYRRAIAANHLLDDSMRVEVVRNGADMAQALGLGALTWDLLDVAEDEAVRLKRRDLLRYVLECKAAFAADSAQALPDLLPDSVKAPANFLLFGIFAALCAGLTLLGVRAWGAWSPARRRVPPYLYRR